YDPNLHQRTTDWIDLIAGGINDNGLVVAQNLKVTNYYQLLEMEFIPQSGPTSIVDAPGYFTWMQVNGLSTAGGVTVIGDYLS
ncbi:hypothetical protein ABTN69_19970, partial [Acinetobacter baumannii]